MLVRASWHRVPKSYVPNSLKQYIQSPSRGLSHPPLLILSVTISGYSSMKSGGPTSIPQHNPNNFTARTTRKVWCDRGMRAWRLGLYHFKQVPSPQPHVLSPTYNMDVYMTPLCQRRDEMRWGTKSSIQLSTRAPRIVLCIEYFKIRSLRI